ncbi:hypothetical protein FGO68_gene11278 [Halteria grandinella]|uniref:Uncharacterized protein n=1 Tax=Halteria grandinella TaxID=5974 RepID=A0A8J8NQ82_HALGN|nr:hypothetical protein FGO68_gene11278 [Halteria grandinella]
MISTLQKTFIEQKSRLPMTVVKSMQRPKFRYPSRQLALPLQPFFNSASSGHQNPFLRGLHLVCSVRHLVIQRESL